MEKLIIENQTDVSMSDVLLIIRYIVKNGRISGEGNKAQYCYHSTFYGIPTEFEVDDGKIYAIPLKRPVEVSAFKNAKSDRIILYYQGEYKCQREK